tara:strand:+ start:204 stop:839 length:636 start_codon:yes stop_codon:yes gene_type:complete
MWEYEGVSHVQGRPLGKGKIAEATMVDFAIEPTTIDGITYESASIFCYAHPDFLTPFQNSIRKIKKENPTDDFLGSLAFTSIPYRVDLEHLKDLPLPIAWGEGISQTSGGSSKTEYAVLPFYRWEVYLYSGQQDGWSRLLIGSGYFVSQKPRVAGREYHPEEYFYPTLPVNESQLVELSRKATLQYNRKIDGLPILNWFSNHTTLKNLFSK